MHITTGSISLTAVCCAPRGRNLLQAFGLNKKLDMLHGRADFQKVGDIDKMLPEGTIDSAGNVEAKKPKATNCREYVDFTLNEPTFTPLAHVYCTIDSNCMRRQPHAMSIHSGAPYAIFRPT